MAFVKGEEYKEGTYLGERMAESGLIVDVFIKDDYETEIPLPDAEQVVRRTPPEVQ